MPEEEPTKVCISCHKPRPLGWYKSRYQGRVNKVCRPCIKQNTRHCLKYKKDAVVREKIAVLNPAQLWLKCAITRFRYQSVIRNLTYYQSNPGEGRKRQKKIMKIEQKLERKSKVLMGIYRRGSGMAWPENHYNMKYDRFKQDPKRYNFLIRK